MISKLTSIERLNFLIRIRNNIWKFLQNLIERKRNIECDIMSLYFTDSYMKLSQKISRSEGVDKYLSFREVGNVFQLIFIKMTPYWLVGQKQEKYTFNF